MKFASLKNGTRDGQLVVVSRDMSRFSVVDTVSTLQDLLDNWDKKIPLGSRVGLRTCGMLGTGQLHLVPAHI